MNSEEVQRLFSALGPHGQQIALLILRRMAANTHLGDFEAGRDWSAQALEEYLDATVYLARELLGGEKKP